MMVLALRRVAGTATALGLALLMIATLVGSSALPARAVELVEGNPQCEVGDHSVKDDPPTLSGFSNGEISITYANATTIASVTAAAGFEIDAVIVKGGDNAYVYTDAPFTGLQAPVNSGGNTPAISHVEVCYSDVESTTSSSEPDDPKEPPPTDPETEAETFDAEFSGSCDVVDGTAVATITVTVTGDEGATGIVRVNGTIVDNYVVDATGVYETVAGGVIGENAVWVHDDTHGPVTSGFVTVPDCTPPPPMTDSAAISGTCVFEEGSSGYPISVLISGDVGATGTIIVNGVEHDYTLTTGADTFNFEGQVGSNEVSVIDSDETVVAIDSFTLEDCSEPDKEPPTPITATLAAQCDLEGDVAVYSILVTVTGDPGETGVVIVDGQPTKWTIGATGSEPVEIVTKGAASTVTVFSDSQGILIGRQEVVAEDCSTTPTQPKDESLVTEDASVSGVCTVDDGADYSVAVEVRGNPGATGIVEVNGAAYAYRIGDGGAALVTVDAFEGDNEVVVIDSVNGEIERTIVTLDDCTEDLEVNAGTTPVAAGGSTGGGAATSPDVSVLGAQLEQGDELPFTGPADGPLAAAGATLVAVGAVLLLATRQRDEDEADLRSGWNLRV